MTTLDDRNVDFKICETLFKLFVNRDDVFAEAYSNGKRMGYLKRQGPVNTALILRHIKGKITLGTYELLDSKLKWGCADFDQNTLEDFEAAKKLCEQAKKDGYHPLPELSGGGKFKCHVWFFVKEAEARDMGLFIQDLCEKSGVQPHEKFPKQQTAKDGFGNLIKMPLGNHLISGKKSQLLDDEFEPITEAEDILIKLQYHLDNLDILPKYIVKEHAVTKVQTPQGNITDFDKFFKFVLNNELPSGITASEKKYAKIEGINANILKNLAIWLHKKGYTQAQLTSEIKPTYDQRGWAFGDLTGWFRKAQREDIKKISTGELVEWCHTYKPELLELLPQKQDEKYEIEPETIIPEVVILENPFKKILQGPVETKHLPNFNKINQIIGLYGSHYLLLEKARYYQLAGGIIQKPITLGQKQLDTRVHCAYPLPTEAGKNELIYLFKEIVKQILKSKTTGDRFTIEEPTSYHPEQLIGKVIERLVDNPMYISGQVKSPKKIKQKIENRGFFDNDFIEIDEANILISQSDEQTKQAREHISKATNPIGRNEVTKKLVDDLPSEKVSYCPNCTFSIYFQPFKIPENLMLQGFLRRFLVPAGNTEPFLSYGSKTLFDKKVLDVEFSKDNVKQELIAYFGQVRRFSESVDIVFTEGFREKLSDYVMYLIEEGRVHSERIANLTKLMKWTIHDYLIKMSSIIALTHFTNIVDENCLALAYMDLVELLQAHFDFVQEWVWGDFDYGVGWQGSSYKERVCLEYLNERGCFSFESSSVRYESTYPSPPIIGVFIFDSGYNCIEY